MSDDRNFDADRPLGPDGIDYLGTDDLALRLSTILRDRSLKDGFVIGVEGRWGAGKSTLIKKTIGHLTASEKPPIIVQFNPWLVGDKRDLIAEFFVGLDEALSQYASKSGLKGKTKKTVESATEALKKYSKHLATGAQFLSAASVIIPNLQPIAKFLDETASGLGGAIGTKSLHEQKSEIEAALRDFKDPIIVFIDDTERLDPPEIMEILRLLRAVGDLPNIIYVVCYDRKALVRSIGIALAGNGHDETGEAYIEKILQATVTIPRPEDFALRRWFLREVQSICSPPTKEINERLQEIVDTEGGGTLETPRDVIRALNSIKLVWPVIHDFVDIPDLVWLHLIKLKRPKLYDWVENYLNGFAEVARGTASASDGVAQANSLFEIITQDYPPNSIRFFRLQEIIPGIGRTHIENGEQGWTVFDVNRNKIDELTQNRRLGSPHYYRYYFALGQNSGFIPGADLNKAKSEIISESSEFVDRLRVSSKQRFADGELHFTVLLDCIRSIVPKLSQEQSKFLLQVIADNTDLAVQNTVDPFFNGRRSLFVPLGILKEIVAHEPNRAIWLTDIVDTAQSLCFLAFFIRYISNNHSYEFNLTDDTVADLIERLSRRVSTLGESLWDHPNPEFVFRVALQNSTQETETRSRLEAFYSDDSNLIRLIGHEDVKGQVITAKREKFRPLNLKAIAEIWGDEQIPQRILSIVKDRDKFSAELQPHIDIIVSGLADAGAASRSNRA
ncbi:MAG: P-loop NTPase fold protein [Hyphomonas sp.]